MHNKSSAHPKRMFKALNYSISGFGFAWQEGAFRLEFFILCIIVLVCIILNLQVWKILAIVCSWVFVLIVEIINSAIEACIDRVSTEIHPTAKLAKDLASASVMLSCILAIGLNILVILV